MQRVLTSELMDDPALGADEHYHALAGLRRINSISRTARYTWRGLRAMATRHRLRSFRLLDVATGGGDVLCAIARLARRDGFAIQATGWDISPRAVAFATRHASMPGVAFAERDALAPPEGEAFEFVISTLFMHHLSSPQATTLLRHMAQLSRLGMLVDDLCRSRSGYWLAWAGCHVLSSSRIVRLDGPVSARGAFTISEASALARQAGLAGARITTHWPQRFMLTWQRGLA
jgi:2-polyprenyl-3-methyl-5-hydroxy-6-metoxy-1,4-benzoquinol methylase